VFDAIGASGNRGVTQLSFESQEIESQDGTAKGNSKFVNRKNKEEFEETKAEE
jgi:hypothetical protein